LIDSGIPVGRLCLSLVINQSQIWRAEIYELVAWGQSWVWVN